MARTDSSPSSLPDETDSAMITVDELKKYYDDGLFRDPVRAVDGVTFQINRGETLGLVGESGCGKSTLGRTLVGIEQPTEGSIVVDGEDIATDSTGMAETWDRDAQIVLQDPEDSINKRMTIGEVIQEPLDAHDWQSPADRRERVFDFLSRVGLREEHYYRYPHQFSGGQLQRISIARALVLEPRFLVLDEPTSALDVSVQARIINLLDELQDELGLTYLFITHDLSVVRHVADRIGVMYLGSLVETGPTDRVFNAPQHPYTASLLSAIPGERTRNMPRQSDSRITLRGTPPNPRNPPSGCPFATRCPAKIRPDGLDLSAQAWDAVDEFRIVLRERADRESSALSTIKSRLGIGAGESIEDIYAELFGSLDLPEEFEETLEEIVELAGDGRNDAALSNFHETVDSVCDKETPHREPVDDSQAVACLRRRDEYEAVSTVLNRRHRD